MVKDSLATAQPQVSMRSTEGNASTSTPTQFFDGRRNGRLDRNRSAWLACWKTEFIGAGQPMTDSSDYLLWGDGIAEESLQQKGRASSAPASSVEQDRYNSFEPQREHNSDCERIESATVGLPYN